ncbi:uncharacterized protein E0L32_010965 [Thyridium curvatum]|uniref:Copper-fist domain-containing protein n=1 Tax=Thyridium curvatum TaxID=1093900 RepID=A0A507AS87_9PEZI|nr:uncharacterized protein E0L32_010965 [Thyridium curvatum]TPX07070.1 hypothetical protein E0L32_010965 [Thyridium curvatum]
MLIDGEKWACEACVRGHRVSNCQHSDRPLQHINKKGRPVSQCGHCRAMRKSKSSHVKCDCGEKTHKCIHLQGVVEGHKGEHATNPRTFSSILSVSDHLASSATESCCCNHGGRCTCSHKKDQPSLDPVPESDSDQEPSVAPKSACAKNPLARRRRANTIHSDGVLSFDENGHHKPTYKHNKASQKTGPYQLNRVNSLHSASSLSNRSVDNLMNGSSNGDSGSTIDSSISSHVLHGKRRVKSEAASPMMNSNAAFSQLNGQLPPLDLSSIEYPSYIAGGFDLFNNLSDHETGLFSAGLSATSVDWSHYDLDFNASKTGDNFAPSSYSQPPSFAGFDFSGSEQAPTLTTNTSGDVSEVEDFLGPSLDDFDASGAFGASTAPNTFSVGGPQTGLFNSNDLGPMDYDDLKIMKVGNKFLPTPASLAGDEPSLGVTSAGANGFSFVEDDPALWVSDYSGLPAMSDNTETGMLPLWDQQ